MRKAFTMIELIFIIVIIGILAAIALPKFTTTSKDAQGVQLAHDLAICISEAGSHFMMHGTFGGVADDQNKQTPNCKRADSCFNFTEYDNNGTLVVVNDPAATSKECLEAQRIARRNVLATSHVINF